MNKIKKYLLNLWYGLPFGLKAAGDEIMGAGDADQAGSEINQQVSDQRVAKHLLKGEVTQEVEELRYRTYKVAEESENYSYIGNGVSIKKGKGKKKNIHKFIQENELMVSSVLEEMQRVGSYGTEKYRFEITYTDFPRFKIEQFATQVDVDINDKDGKIETSFHFSTRPNPYDMKSKPFITEAEKLEYVKNDHISGGIYRITAERGAKIRLEMELKESSDSESVITIAEADRELFDQIGTIILRAGLEHAGNYPERDPYQMPDTTSHLKVVEPYKTFSITSLMDLNESELQALNEIVALLEEAFH